MAVSFVAVAILAAVANFMVERGVSIVRTFDRGAVERSSPVSNEVRRTAPAQPESRVANADRLMLALDRLERAAHGRAEINSLDTTSQYQKMIKGLDRTYADYGLELASIGAQPGTALTRDLNAYKAYAEELIELSDMRRVLLDKYATRFESITSRMRTSLEGSWKIFGRVLARQSLMQLRSNLDEMRHDFVGLSTTDADPAAVQAIVQSEAGFAETFKRGEKGFLRSEGALWVRQTQDDFAELVSLRAQLVDLGLKRSASTRNLSDAGAALDSKLSRTMIPVLPAASRVTKLFPQTGMAAPFPSVVSEPVTTTTVRNDTQGRALVAWITTAVLAMLTAISVWTVRSIAIPVRRMLKATEQLARGQVTVRVPRGGIRELDTLGVAFNQMAEQLAAAQELTQGYQHHLEAEVERRTQQLQQLAEHDPLTLLPNRRQLFALLNTSIQRADIARRYVGVLLLDIDNFKNLNDSMGHGLGDRVLISIAQRLNETVRPFGFAARLGGDEFTVVYQDAADIDTIREAGETLVRAFQKSLLVDGRELVVSISVGASVYPDHEQTSEALLSAADAALFRAKALGRSQLAMFTPELLAAAASKFNTEQGLRRAIERSEFELVYQPEVQLNTLDVTLVEALIRWRLPDGRLASPAEFLTVAEESGLIIQIGDWVLRAAIETAAHWHHGAWPEARVAINVSPRQLMEARFVDQVMALLQEFRLPVRCIEIELTETVLQTGPATIDTLRRLRALGIAVALDDFGTGYSSLASLQELPLTRVKLDRSLIASIETSPRSAAIARAIISLCNSLGLEITAEGIERPEQLACLLENPRIYLQGYLLSRPVSREELMAIKATIPERMQDLLLSMKVNDDSADEIEILFTSQKNLSSIGT